MDDLRLCKKCLLKDMPEADYFKNLYDYIEHLDPDIKASGEVYEERLGVCRECDQLLAGMCRVCGCYVELRAVMKGKECPDGRW